MAGDLQLLSPIEMYTSPLCTSSYADLSGPEVLTISNVLETVDELRVNAFRILICDQVGTLSLSMGDEEELRLSGCSGEATEVDHRTCSRQ